MGAGTGCSPNWRSEHVEFGDGAPEAGMPLAEAEQLPAIVRGGLGRSKRSGGRLVSRHRPFIARCRNTVEFVQLLAVALDC